jgi:hypothetical protein
MTATSERSNTPIVVVVVAIVGLLSTVAASFLSAYSAVQVAQSSFYNERNAALQDERRAIYADFLKSVVLTCISIGTGDQDKQNQAFNELQNNEARVALIAKREELRTAASEMVNAIVNPPKDGKKHVCDNPNTLAPYRNKFIASAQTDVKENE